MSPTNPKIEIQLIPEENINNSLETNFIDNKVLLIKTIISENQLTMYILLCYFNFFFFQYWGLNSQPTP
jgi:hypothetical protein